MPQNMYVQRLRGCIACNFLRLCSSISGLNSHYVNFQKQFTKTWTDPFWAKKILQIIEKRKKYSAEHWDWEKIILPCKFLEKKFLIHQKSPTHPPQKWNGRHLIHTLNIEKFRSRSYQFDIGTQVTAKIKLKVIRHSVDRDYENIIQKSLKDQCLQALRTKIETARTRFTNDRHFSSTNRYWSLPIHDCCR